MEIKILNRHVLNGQSEECRELTCDAIPCGENSDWDVCPYDGGGQYVRWTRATC